VVSINISEITVLKLLKKRRDKEIIIKSKQNKF
jgi:hypothetical protein